MLGPLVLYGDLMCTLAFVTTVTKIFDISHVIMLAHRSGGLTQPMVICSRELGQVITALGIGGDSLPLGKQQSDIRHAGMCWAIYSPQRHNVSDQTPSVRSQLLKFPSCPGTEPLAWTK